MNRQEITAWLRETDAQRLEELWARADDARRRHVGDAVHLRGLIEISNICCRRCHYCGLRADNAALGRYRMTADEIWECVQLAVQFGYGTVVMQAGEDPGIERDEMADLIRRIKRQTPLAVTLSLGERSDDDFLAWKQAGANRYLLRFETSNRILYDRIHPPRPGVVSDRFAILARLRQLGYEIGSGVMAGIPGQTYEDLANDVEKFAELRLDMIGIGPFIPHAATPLGRDRDALLAAPGLQAPNDELMTYKMVALTRLACPDANIPSTTALATLNKAQGRELGLARGANIVMPNLTPPKYRVMYEIYPNKACIFESAGDCSGCIKGRITAMGRTVGAGPGTSPGFGKK